MDDWAVIAVSAGLSSIISVLVSLLAIEQTTVRQARAERADQARQAVRKIVEGLQDDLARYRYLGQPEPQRSAEESHMTDHTHVARIRAAAADLRWHRRWLVDRRCRKTFGDYWTDLAIGLPTTPDEFGTFAAWLASSKKNGNISPGKGPIDGLLHRAYSEPPGHPLQEDLRRNLRRLAACR